MTATIPVLGMDKAKELVSLAIAEKGEEYVYQREGTVCSYVHQVGEVWDEESDAYEEDYSSAVPGCLVGHALHLGGVSLQVLSSYNLDGSHDLLNALKRVNEIGEVSQPAARYLSQVQGSQDNGASWGLANEAALRGKMLCKKYDEYGRFTGEFNEID